MDKSISRPSNNKKSSSKKRSSNTTKEMTPAKLYATSIFKGFAVGALVLLLTLSLFSIIIVKSDYSVKSLPIMTIVCCIMSTYIGGYWSSKFIKKRGLVVGIFTSVPLIILVIILATIANAGNLNYFMIINIILMLIFGAIGGIMSVNKSPKRHK